MATVYDPINIGTLKLRNRFAVAPTVKNFSTERGYISDEDLINFAADAKGGSGLVIVSLTFVRADGRIFPRQIGIDTDSHLTGHGRLTKVIHSYGAKVALQLGHGGALCESAITGFPVLTPSGVPQTPGQQNLKVMTLGECEEIAEAFAAAAFRAVAAGYDGIELHNCHGSLLSQFMSPSQNKRTDKYRGPTAFLVDVIRAVKAKIGKDFPLWVRFSTDEFLNEIGEEGTTIERFVKEVLPIMEKEGINAIHASAGRIVWTCWNQIPPLYRPRGVNVRLAEEVKKHTKLPVIAIGRLNDPVVIEDVVAKGRTDIVALCRAIIADQDIVRKMIEGRPEEVRKCIACNYCSDVIWGAGNFCTINPSYGNENLYHYTPARPPKKVLVAGGGIAGMEAARVLKEVGHNVTLYEKSDKLGGLIHLAANIPRLSTRETLNIYDWISYHLKKLNVKVVLNKEVTSDLVRQEKPDAVFIATGSKPLIPEIPGVDRKNVFTYDDYVLGKATVGAKVAVLGGNHGAETAVSLGRDNKNVFLVEETDQVAMVDYTRLYGRYHLLMRFLNEAKAQIRTGLKVKEITEKGVKVEDPAGKQELIEVDTVILALGRVAVDDLYSALRGLVPKIHKIGDCFEPRRLLEAIQQANIWALSL